MKLRDKKSVLKKGYFFFLLLLILAVSFWMIFFQGKKLEIFKTEAYIKKSANINPDEKIIIYFSSSFKKSSYSGKIKIIPEIKFSESYEKNRIVLTPQSHWPIGKRLSVILPQGKNFSFFPIEEKTFDLSVSNYPSVSYFYPFPDSRDVVIDIEDPIEIAFQESTRGFYLNFETTPSRKLVIESDENKRVFKILPEENFPKGQSIAFKIFSRFSGDSSDKYEKIYEGNFYTLPAYPSEWPRDLQARLYEAKRFTDARVKEGKYIDINLEAQVLSIFENGKRLNSFLISSGKNGMETPKGEFEVYNKHPRPWSRTYNLFMPYWMAITSSGKYGIHELPEWPGGYKEGSNHLGIPVSHGCIRLGVGPAKEVYSWTEIGTKVIIY